MPGPPPKPDAQRRRRNAPTFDWVDLPTGGRAGDPPPLPGYRSWSEQVTEWWSEIWRTPQATEWQQSGVTLWPLAELLEQLARGETATHVVVSAMLPIWREHGLSPAGLQQRRWRVPKLAPVEERSGPSGDGQQGSVTRLRQSAAGVSPPAVRAAKSEWVEHAVRSGFDRRAAAELSKKELVARFGGAKRRSSSERVRGGSTER